MTERASFPAAALLAAFALHNAEEISFGDRGIGPDPKMLARLGLDPQDYRADRMALATAMLTAVVALATRPREHSQTSAMVSIAAAGALGVNAVAHVAQAVRNRRYNPGLATAPAMLVAAATQIVLVQRESRVAKTRAAAAILAAGALSVPAIVVSLRVARWIRPSSTSSTTPFPSN